MHGVTPDLLVRPMQRLGLSYMHGVTRTYESAFGEVQGLSLHARSYHPGPDEPDEEERTIPTCTELPPNRCR